MKLFTYNHPNPWEQGYGAFYFIHAYPAQDQKLVSTSYDIHSCREFFTMDYAKSIAAGNKNAYVKSYALVTDGARRTGISAPAWIEQVKNSISMLNKFEKEYEIPFTRIYPTTTRWRSAALIIGSKRWNMNRYSFGLWTLFFRIGQTSAFTGNTVKKLIPSMKWKEIYNRVIESSDSGTLEQARYVFPKVESFFEFEKTAFGTDRQENWAAYSASPNQRPEGIMKLVIGNSYSSKLKELWRQHEIAYKKSKKAV